MRLFLQISLSALLLLVLVACRGVVPPETPTAPAPGSPTPQATPTPTPIPPILTIPLKTYTAPHELFRLEIPESWEDFKEGGGIRFQDPADPYVSLTAYYYPLPKSADPDTFLDQEAERALSRARLNDPNSLSLIINNNDENNHRHLEAVGRFFMDQPLQHLRAEIWLDNGVLLGLNLMAPESKWPQVEPIWPLLRQSYQVLQPDPSQIPGMAYIHPGGLFTLTVPLYWGVLDESYEGVILQDMEGLAQFSVGVQEMDHYPTPQELDDALAHMVGETAQAPGYQILQKIDNQPNLRLIQFEVPTEHDGIYRTEIRVFRDRNLLITTAFGAPSHDWETFAADYRLLLESLKTRGNAPPDEATQDEDPLAGIEVGVVHFYVARNGRLQVSAPIRNFRTRNVTRLTASVIMYDKDGQFLAAESWRMLQQILGKGKTTYLYLAIPKASVNPKKVAKVTIRLIDARDAVKEPYPAWGYQHGNAEVNAQGDVVVRATMRNTGNQTQKYIFLAVLLYDAQGNLLFVRTERQRLPHAVPPGKEVDVKMTIPGPLEAIGTFDVVGERPLLD